MSGPFPFFAVAAPGFEPLLADELATLGLADVAAEEGGVRFAGTLLDGGRANLESRLATRVLLRLGVFPATGTGELARGIEALDWGLALRRGVPLDVRVTSHGSRLRGPRLAPTLDTLVARARDRVGGPPAVATAAPQRVQVRVVADEVTVSLDLSGERLDRRGYRTRTVAAPLRETLAAAVLRLAGWTPSQPLVDPLTGSGTIAIEAALQALAIPAGHGRTFAVETWPAWERAAWRDVLAEQSALRRDRPPAPILASDADPRALDDARANAARAGVADAIEFAVRPVVDAAPPDGPPGLVVVDPPYGRRLGSRGEWKPLYRQIGATLSGRFRGWRAGVLCPDRRLERELRLLVVARHALPHGGRRVDLLIAAL